MSLRGGGSGDSNWGIQHQHQRSSSSPKPASPHTWASVCGPNPSQVVNSRSNCDKPLDTILAAENWGNTVRAIAYDCTFFSSPSLPFLPACCLLLYMTAAAAPAAVASLSLSFSILLPLSLSLSLFACCCCCLPAIPPPAAVLSLALSLSRPPWASHKRTLRQLRWRLQPLGNTCFNSHFFPALPLPLSLHTCLPSLFHHVLDEAGD